MCVLHSVVPSGSTEAATRSFTHAGRMRGVGDIYNYIHMQLYAQSGMLSDIAFVSVGGCVCVISL